MAKAEIELNNNYSRLRRMDRGRVERLRQVASGIENRLRGLALAKDGTKLDDISITIRQRPSDYDGQAPKFEPTFELLVYGPRGGAILPAARPVEEGGRVVQSSNLRALAIALDFLEEFLMDVMVDLR